MKNKIFVVSWINFFDNELHMEKVSAESEVDAFYKSSQDLFEIPDELEIEPDRNMQTLDGLKEFAWDCDSMINVLEI